VEDTCKSASRWQNLAGMTKRHQWPKVDLGFKLWPPLLKRAAGRPRTRRYKGWKKTCNKTVLDPNAPPPAPP
jgi:hypothetical protein